MPSVQENSTYSLTNVEGGTCIDLSGGDGISVIGYGYHDGGNQKWTFENAGGDQAFFIKSQGSGKYLAAGGDLHNGQKVVAAGPPYAWRVDDEQGVDGGLRFSPAGDLRFSVDLSNHGNPTPGTPIELWTRWEGHNQVWKPQQV